MEPRGQRRPAGPPEQEKSTATREPLTAKVALGMGSGLRKGGDPEARPRVFSRGTSVSKQWPLLKNEAKLQVPHFHLGELRGLRGAL